MTLMTYNTKRTLPYMVITYLVKIDKLHLYGDTRVATVHY